MSSDYRFACIRRKLLVSLNLSAVRRRCGFKQREVADLIGINSVTLSGYETGKNEPPMEVLVRLSDLYGVSLDSLLCR